MLVIDVVVCRKDVVSYRIAAYRLDMCAGCLSYRIVNRPQVHIISRLEIRTPLLNRVAVIETYRFLAVSIHILSYRIVLAINTNLSYQDL